jgi:hypothetical protein
MDLGWVASLGLAGLLVLAIITERTKLPGEEMTPAGLRRSTSEYVRMRDGVEIAVTVNLPADLKSGERVPVLMRTTRYWRAPGIGWTLRMLVALHQASPASDASAKPTSSTCWQSKPRVCRWRARITGSWLSTKNFTTSGARRGQFDKRRRRGSQGYLRALETDNPSGFRRMWLPRPAIPEHR